MFGLSTKRPNSTNGDTFSKLSPIRGFFYLQKLLYVCCMITKINDRRSDIVTSTDCKDFAEVMAFLCDYLDVKMDVMELGENKIPYFDVGSLDKVKNSPPFMLRIHRGEYYTLPQPFIYNSLAFDYTHRLVAFYFEQSTCIEFVVYEKPSDMYLDAAEHCKEVEAFRKEAKKGKRVSDSENM